MAADSVFSVANGGKKPSKYLKLGPAVKSITVSKKLIGMLNRYGTVLVTQQQRSLKRI